MQIFHWANWNNWEVLLIRKTRIIQEKIILGTTNTMNLRQLYIKTQLSFRLTFGSEFQLKSKFWTNGCKYLAKAQSNNLRQLIPCTKNEINVYSKKMEDKELDIQKFWHLGLVID